MMCPTSGWRLLIIAKQSVQLAQCAAQHPRAALVKPNPPWENCKEAVTWEWADGSAPISRARHPQGIFSCTPDHVAFCPIFVHPLFPGFEPHIQKWVIFVRRHLVSVTLSDSNPRPSAEKDLIWQPRQLNFPNVKNDDGQKHKSLCF